MQDKRQWSNLLHRRPTTTPSKNGNWRFAQEWWKLEAHIPALYLHARHGDMNDVSRCWIMFLVAFFQQDATSHIAQACSMHSCWFLDIELLVIHMKQSCLLQIK